MPDLEVQVFRYPLFRHPWYKFFIEVPIALLLICELMMVPCLILAFPQDPYRWRHWGFVLTACFLFHLIERRRRMATGRIELTPTTLTRYFGFGNRRRLTLAWNDVVYSVKTPSDNKTRLELSSEAGNYKFYVPDTVENFGELQNIIQARATQHYKDIKRGQLPVS